MSSEMFSSLGTKLNIRLVYFTGIRKERMENEENEKAIEEVAENKKRPEKLLLTFFICPFSIFCSALLEFGHKTCQK